MCTSPLYRVTSTVLELEKKAGDIPPLLKQRVLAKGYAVIGWRHYLDYKNRYLIPENFFTMLPCGKCTECRIKKVKEWSARCLAEKKTSENVHFVTLTYSDENLKFREVDGVYFPILCKEDVQKFFKRLRKHFFGNSGGNIRYFLSGEYGENTLRPHYHAIIYNLPLDDLRLYKVVGKTIYYISDLLSSIWGLGHVVVGKVNDKTVSYTCSYTLKKVGFLSSPESALAAIPRLKEAGKPHDLLKAYIAADILPRPFALMSRRKAIGREYYENNRDEILNGLPSFNLSKIGYYDNLLKSEDELLFDDLKDTRSSIAEGARVMSEKNLSLSEEAKFKHREDSDKVERKKTIF